MEEDKLTLEKKRKLNEIQDMGVNPYAYSFNKNVSAKKIQKDFENLNSGEKSEKEFSFAGRIMQMRNMGKASFITLQDETGRVQIYLRKDELDKEYDVFNKTDIGDYIGVVGTIFKTKKGEVTIHASKFVMLSKSLRTLPEKFHGIKDPELKFRKRYLDFIMNPEEKKKFRMRSKIIKFIRDYLDNLNYLEVETPVLQTIYGGTNAKPFTTHINAYNMKMYLRVAPELYLKRLLVGGFERVYEIARNFRNEGADQTHNPEFTMIEWYEAYGDYHTMMDRAEELIKSIAKELFGKEEIMIHEEKVDISKPWPRITMTEAIKKFLDMDIESVSDDELLSFVKEKKIEIVGDKNRGQMVFAIFDKLVSDQLIAPIWIIDYPKEVSPLAKKHRDNPNLVERFECYIGGKEINDGWSELINPIDQRDRFEKEQESMRAGNDEAHPRDEDFLEALEYGMPPCGGIGMGIDRLVMLFTNNWSIREILFFPTMKPKG